MGSAVGRDTGILHVRVCAGSDDSDSGLGNDSASRQGFRKQHDSFCPHGDFTVGAAVVACADIGRPCRMEFFPDTAGVFIARDIARNVYVSS